MTDKSYALIVNDSSLVLNTIVADENYKSNDNFIIELQDGIRCEPGMFYNTNDGLFYDKPAIKK